MIGCLNVVFETHTQVRFINHTQALRIDFVIISRIRLDWINRETGRIQILFR